MYEIKSISNFIDFFFGIFGQTVITGPGGNWTEYLCQLSVLIIIFANKFFLV